MLDRSLQNEPESAPANSAPARKVHPTVTLNYPVRVASHFLVFVIMASVLVHAQAPMWAWLWLGATGFLWGHLAFFLASRARDTKRAELRNVLADNLLIGGFAALSGFSLWPSAMMFTAIVAASLCVSGPAFTLRGVVAFALGSLLMLSITGVVFTPEASLSTAVVSATALFLFCTMLGLYSNLAARRAVHARRAVQAQSLHIEEQRQQVLLSRDLAEAEKAAANQARDLADAANRAKSSFLANMSHELRTPLNAIIGYAEMLEEDIDDAAQRSDLKKIRSSGKHLLGLINDVLDLSKIEAGKVDLHIDVFDVGQLIDQVVSTVRPLLDKNGNRFELRVQSPLGVMTSDATRLRQVLLNLLSNAAKFTQQGEVILAVRREAGERGGWLQFEVMDSGIGMTPEQLLKLFQPFVQADANTTRLYGGTGLGLVISRRLCQMMGGTVSVDSEAGYGTRFKMRVPARAPATTETAAIDDESPGVSATLSVADAASRRTDRRLPGQAEPERDPRIISQDITAPPVFRIAPEGMLLTLNAAMARMLGYSSPEQLLLAVTDVGMQLFVSSEIWSHYRRRLLNEGLVTNFEFEGRRADGSLMWLSQDACAVRDEKGSVTHFECFAKDITELKRTCLALRQQLRQAMNGTSANFEPPRSSSDGLTLTAPRATAARSPARRHTSP